MTTHLKKGPKELNRLSEKRFITTSSMTSERQLLLYLEEASKMMGNIHNHQETEFAPILQIDVATGDKEDVADLRAVSK